MALLLNGRELKKSFGARPLFEGISLTISDGDRLGLIGPNGTGKSTLLQILAGRVDTDKGEVALRRLARMTYVQQESVFTPGITVAEAVKADEDPRQQSMLSQAGFDDIHVPVESLSGGWKKRVAIIQALTGEPDLLLLDEPTNHLDLQGILWLEKLLAQARFAAIVITHDRYFLENVSTHVAEMAPAYPGGLFMVKGAYGEFLETQAGVSAGTSEARRLTRQSRAARSRVAATRAQSAHHEVKGAHR